MDHMSLGPRADLPALLRYRGFDVRPAERRVLVNGQHAVVGARAFDLLLALIQRADRIVDKHELLEVVWSKTVVEENNLQVHIHTLRRLLGANAITTVPGRGYRFTAEPAEPADLPDAPQRRLLSEDIDPAGYTTTMLGRHGNVPRKLLALYGRDADRAAVMNLVAERRLVTISGAGGIGKTRLAQAVALAIDEQGPVGAWMTELAWTTDATALVAHIAQALGIALQGQRAPLDELADALRGQSLLLVLDNCEHLLDAVGRVVQRLLAEVPGLRLLTTSQELLRVDGEHVYKLEPLDVPATHDPQLAMGYGAVRLFVERARAQDRHFALDAHNVADVIEICTRLDGMALAIELAAVRVKLLGPHGVRALLGERFRLLTGGARVSLRRHQTLRLTLDWSHQLLNADEQTVFRRIGLFSDGFGIEAAQRLAGDQRIDDWAVLDLLGALVDKSLVLVEGAEQPRYRLLETMRAYALERLAEAGETDAWLRRHAETTLALCEAAVKRRDMDAIWCEMNNIRAAYDWASRPGGDVALAVGLLNGSAMVLAVAGQASEALQRLLEMESRVGDDLPPALAAQYWQWLGRCGIGGRLPTSRCVAALRKAEQLFRQLNKPRHLHACLRMRAEALVAVDDIASAQDALQEAEAMEKPGWPVADRMRRLRVLGLVHAATGNADQALATARHAFDMAQAANIERYMVILLSDMADVHLNLGLADEAARQYRELAALAQQQRGGGLTLAQALAGLTAALLALGDVAAAQTAAARATPMLLGSGTFVAHADVFGQLAAAIGAHEVAARLLGAAEHFHQSRETVRDEYKLRARADAVQRLASSDGQGLSQAWMAEGRAEREDVLAQRFAQALSAAQPDGEPTCERRSQA